MKFLYFDIESTTGSHTDGSMCSFGYCLTNENFEIEKNEDIVMCPKIKKMDQRFRLHYDKEFIKKQPNFVHFYEKINNIFKESQIVIGFAVLNDVEFLNNACDIYNLERIYYNYLDVQLVYKLVYKKQNSSGLENIANELNLNYEPHKSSEDARVTMLILKHICFDIKLTIKEIIKKYGINLGINSKKEIISCNDGSLNKAEKKYLFYQYKLTKYKHNNKYKGGLSLCNFAFSDDIITSDIYLIRNVLNKIFDLNGKVSDYESCNIYVCDNFEKDKHRVKVLKRNEKTEIVKIISYENLLNMVGELAEQNFEEDKYLLNKYKIELKKKKELKKKLKKQLNNKKKP